MFSQIAAAALLGASFVQAAPYPRGELLIEASELASKEVAQRYRILDVRSSKAYGEGHVPGAIRIPHDEWAKGFAANPAGPGGLVFTVGITPKARFVIYDDGTTKDAARIWWILRYWGVQDVRLLHGGWPAWTAGKHLVSKLVSTIPGELWKIEATSRLATKDFLLDILKAKEKKTQIIDTRSSAEFCGETKLAKRSGAIPTATHLEWTEVLDPATKRFKKADALSKLFKDAGIDLDRPTVTYCQSGGRAAVMAFTLELMGARDVRNYYRSWSEWGNAEDTPIVMPKPKSK